MTNDKTEVSKGFFQRDKDKIESLEKRVAELERIIGVINSAQQRPPNMSDAMRQAQTQGMIYRPSFLDQLFQ